MGHRLQRFVEFVPRRWLAAAAGLVLGLFVARVAYEMWPGPLAVLVYWPAGPALALGVAALVTIAYRVASRNAGIGYPIFLPWFLLLLYILQPSVNLLQALVLFAGAAALSSMYLAQALGAQEWQMRWGARLVLAAAALALYLPTVGRTVGKADTFEFQVVAPALGVAHPTGYPLFILLGKLFSLLPVGQVAWRVNLTSVACAMLAVGVLYTAISKVLARGNDLSRCCALIAALVLAASPVFWSQAVVAEVYALNAVFVALVLWLALYGLDRRQQDDGWDARRWLFGLALIYGVSLTNHLTMVLLAPVLALAIWWVRPRASWLGWLAAAALFALGLSIYSYILVRWPALHNGQAMPFSDLIGWITGRQFGGALQPWLWRDPTRWRILGRLLLEAYGPVGAGLAALGLVSLAWPWKREKNARRVALVTTLAFVTYCAYALIYNVPDISVFLIPAHLVMAVWLGVGIFQISNFRVQINDQQPPYGRTSNEQSLSTSHSLLSNLQSLIPNISSLLFILLPLSLIWTNLPQVDQSKAGQSLVDWGQYVLSLPLPRQAAILADSEKIAPLYYLKSVEGVRSDVDMLVLGTEDLYRAELDRRVAEGQPVYLARFLPGLAGVYRLHSVGPLVRVSTAPQSTLPLVPITQQLNVAFGEGRIKLLGYDLSPGQDDVAYHLTLYWQAKTALTSNYHVRLRLASEADTMWWEDPGTHPVSGYDPTVAWLPDEVVPDYHEIPASRTMPPGRYYLQVGLFVPFRDEGLVLDGSINQEWYDVAQVDLAQAAGEEESPALPVTMRANYGGQVLLRGASQPGVIAPGGRGEVTLEWERLAEASNYDLQLTLARANGTPAAVVRIKPFAGEYPLPRWDIGRPVRMQVSFPAPDQPGEYTLRVGWVTDQNRWVTARCGWMGRAASECTLTIFRVEGARRESGVNFADQVVLAKSQVGSETLHPGETLDVNLHWQGLQAWPADYTVFVHLIGPDGKLYGQVDAYPVQGTLPTTQWKAGQLVDDPYVVALAPDAPAGDYQIEVGWYLLATLRRLSVLDSAGRPVDDHVIVGKVSVAP
jgi:hypothetical protein